MLQYFSAVLPRAKNLGALGGWRNRALSRSVRRGTLLLGELKRPTTVGRLQTLLRSALKTRGLVATTGREYVRGWVRPLSKEEFETAVEQAEDGERRVVRERPPQFAALARDALGCARGADLHARDAELAGMAAGAKRSRTKRSAMAAAVVTEGPGPELQPLPKRRPCPSPVPVAVACLERRRELLRELEEDVNLPARRKSMVSEGIPPLPRGDLTLLQVAQYPEASLGHSDPVLQSHLRDDALLVDPGFAAALARVVQTHEDGEAAAPSASAGLSAPRLR